MTLIISFLVVAQKRVFMEVSGFPFLRFVPIPFYKEPGFLPVDDS